jgi:hypothetical protein
MKKLLFSILVSSLLLFQFAFAADFTVKFDKDQTYPFYATKTDYLYMTINNPTLEDGWFQATIWGSNPDWITIENSPLMIPAMSSGIVNMKVNPSRYARPEIYQYFYKVTRLAKSDDIIDDKILVNVVQVTSAIMKDISLSCKSCLDSVDVSGNVVNFVARSLDLSVVLKYGDRQKTLNLGKVTSNGEVDFKTTLDLGGMNPGDYKLDISLVDDTGKVQYTESASFKVPVVDNIVYSKKVSSTPFGSSITVTASNRGNVVSNVDLKSVSPQSWYSVISGPNPSGMMTGYYVWTKSLNPKDSITLNYSEIYWPTYVLIIAMVGIFLVIYWQSSAFTFNKVIMGKSTIRSGKDISISLHLRSKRKGIDKVAIRDIIPADFSIVSNFETVKPLIRKVTEGVELIWKLGGLNPNEERVLHYTIRPNMELSRNINLPAALAKAASGKSMTVKRSNRVLLTHAKEPVKLVPVRVAK